MSTSYEDAPETEPLEQLRRRSAVAKLNYSHEAMINHLLVNPQVTQNELAEMFGYTPAWVCQVMASDAFRAKLAERRAEIVDPELRAQSKRNYEALLIRGQELLLEKLNAPTAQIKDETVLKTLELSGRALGYGAKQPAAVPQHVETHLTILGDQLTKMLRKGREDVEAEYEVHSDDEGLQLQGSGQSSEDPEDG